MRFGLHRPVMLLLALLFAMKASAQPPVDQQWLVRYDGFAHDNDSAFALVVDQGGNVIVTGVCQT